ncbi:MAG: hypothetical protein WBN04_14625, partial [Paracoccaceae bacterium]
LRELRALERNQHMPPTEVEPSIERRSARARTSNPKIRDKSIPIFRQTSPTDVPASACLSAKAIYSSENRFFGIGTFLLHRKCTKNSHSVRTSFRG